MPLKRTNWLHSSAFVGHFLTDLKESIFTVNNPEYIVVSRTLDYDEFGDRCIVSWFYYKNNRNVM